MWAQAINAILGLWLLFAPWVLDFNGPARIVDRIAGPIAFTFALWALRDVTRGVRVVNVLVGLWVLTMPWAFHYESAAATINGIVVGLALIMFALIRGPIHQRFGSGWRGLIWAATEDIREERRH